MLRRNIFVGSSSSFAKAFGFASIFSLSSAGIYSSANASTNTTSTNKKFSLVSGNYNYQTSFSPASCYMSSYRHCSTATSSSSSSSPQNGSSNNNKPKVETTKSGFSVTEIKTQLLKAKGYFDHARFIFSVATVMSKFFLFALILFVLYQLKKRYSGFVENIRNSFLQSKDQTVVNARNKVNEVKSKVIENEKVQQVRDRVASSVNFDEKKKDEHLAKAKEKFGEAKEKAKVFKEKVVVEKLANLRQGKEKKETVGEKLD